MSSLAHTCYAKGMTEIAAILACIILTGLAVFQVALILGAPIGRFSWGGNHTILPRNLRIASVTSIMLYLLFAVFALNKTGVLTLIANQSTVTIGMWIFTAYFFLGIFMNAISRSKPERNLMTPVAAALAVLFLIIALN